ELVLPNKSGHHMGYRGWAYCAATKGKDWLLLYFDRECPRATVRGLVPGRTYQLRWFDPRTGEWVKDKNTDTVTSNGVGRILLPDFPSDADWGLSLVHLG
ncbi:MAG TPA: putative collagen-binding domain-containing protein, partial [Clostridia bacterium]